MFDVLREGKFVIIDDFVSTKYTMVLICVLRAFFTIVRIGLGGGSGPGSYLSDADRIARSG